MIRFPITFHNDKNIIHNSLENSSEIKNSISAKRPAWSRSWWQVKIFIAGILLYYLFSSGKLSFSQFRYTFSPSSLIDLIIVAGLLIIAYLLTAWRIFLLFRARGTPVSPRFCFQINLVGFFFNNFLPASIGGDAMRAYYFAGGRRENLASILATLVYDRMLGFMALVLVAFLGLSLALAMDQGFVWSAEFRWAFLGLFAVLLVFVLSFCLSRWVRFMATLQSVLAGAPLGAAISRFFAGIADLSRYGLLSLALLGISLGPHLASALALYFTGRAFGIDTSFWMTIILSPLIFLSGIIPLSPNNIGWTEYLGSLIWSSQGSGQGANLWMAFRLVCVLVSLSGLIAYLRLRAGVLPDES